MLSEERLKEIEERCKATTAGPWIYVRNLLGIFFEKVSSKNLLLSFLTHKDQRAKASVEDAIFIANARQDIPDLLTAIMELKAERKRITEIIARNCVAWDTSKDKTLGLLPEVVIFNHGLYKQLTGREYSFREACEKFNIGEP